MSTLDDAPQESAAHPRTELARLAAGVSLTNLESFAEWDAAAWATQDTLDRLCL